jgi:uncharacterized protein (DUF2267 family)
MSTIGLPVFDKTLQETHHWLRIVMEELETDNRRLAFQALRAGLHAVRDRIGAANAVHLGAQLPMLLRGAYYENWRPFDTPTRERKLGDFFSHVEAYLPANAQLQASCVAHATATAMAECLDGGEIEKVIAMLPTDIRVLWPDYSGQAEFSFAG